MAITNTDNGFKNGVGVDLMKVSGNTSYTTYTASTFSSSVSDVIMVKFKDPFRGTNFRTAYDPTATSTDSSKQGFREEFFLEATSQENYDILKHFRVKQIDGETGTVRGEGIPLRWVPPSAQGGDGFLFIKVLFHDSIDNPSVFNQQNGVIYCDVADGFEYDGKEFPSNPCSYGSSILSITPVSNVYKITTKESKDSNSGDTVCGSGPSGFKAGKGLYVSGQKVHLKTSNEVCASSFRAVGTVISVAVDSASQKISVFIEFDSNLDVVTGTDGFCQGDCNPQTLYLCTGDSNGTCTATCAIYGVDAIRKISTPSCGTVQKIVFAEDSTQNGEYVPSDPGERNIYQWNYNFCGNHPGNGQFTENKQDDTLAKITAEYMHWDSQNKILYVMCPDQIMRIEYGNVYQKISDNTLISRGSGIFADGAGSNFTRKTGSFVNIKNYPGISTYVPGKEYSQGWESGGELLVQRTSSADTTGYNSRFEYVLGETVIQALTEVVDSEGVGTITNYAAGVVVGWEPNKTALSTIPSVLAIKRLTLGTDNPKEFNTTNSLISKTKELCRFRYGNGIAPMTSGTTLKNSKRNILPLRVFQSVNDSGTTTTDWYDFSSDYVVQRSVINENLTDLLTETIGTMAKGSAIGTTRIKAMELESGNEYRLSLMNPVIFFNEPVSFRDVSGIGVTIAGQDPVPTDNIEVTYEQIVKIININQDVIDGKNVTKIKNPTTDKQIIPLPGPDIIENVISGAGNFSANELTVQKLYNVIFTNNQITIPVNQTGSSFIPNAEFPNYLSSRFSFAIDQNSGNSLNLIRYTDLETQPTVEPSDDNTLYYDILETNGNRLEVFFKKKTNGSITNVLFGSDIKCTVVDVIKNKKQKQFSLNVSLEYQTSGEFKDKWIGVLRDTTGALYDVDSLISIFAITSTGIATDNIKSLFGISKQTDDYSYKPSIVVLSSEGTKINTNRDPALGPITPSVPKFGVFNRIGFTDTYTVPISVSGYCRDISAASAGIILRESYKDFNDNTLSIKNIPFYKSKTDGAEYHPSILLDCRPLINMDNLAGATKFVVLPSSSTINTTVQGYLPRNDILYLSKNGRFKFVYGVPAFIPKYPELPEPGMILYKIKKPSYIFNNEDLNLMYTDNRRYTMRDIGRLDKRIQQLESYSSLSLLEKNADSMLIEDANGNNRFKNGIIVDPFQNHKIGEVSHPDYYIAIDGKNSTLRPVGLTENIAIKPTTNTNTNQFIHILNTNTGVRTSGPIPAICPPVSTGLYMMPFTQVPFVVQPMATKPMSLTPFDIINMEGTVRLLPREDDWVDTETKPALNVNLAGENDVWDKIVDQLNSSTTGPFALNYGNWTEISKQVDVNANTEYTTGGKRHGRWWEQWKTTTTTNTTINEQRTITGEQLRSGTEQVNLGERVVDVSLIPYMRGKRIRVAIIGMKSNARIYPFFDGIDVSQNCYWYESIDAMDAAVTADTLNSDNKFSGSIRKTTAQGNVFLIFEMPGGIFRTGDRKFTISDNPNNDFTKATTYATGTYSASGLSQVRETTMATVRNFSTENVEWSEDRSLFSTNTQVDIRRQSHDPLAQTFVINKELYPDGIYLSSVDLFFARKPDNSTNIPVEVQIRPVVNGFPDSYKIQPGAISTLHPAQINVSDTPSANNTQTATRFNFETPVYLEPGEHSLVVKSTSLEYEMYIAEIGQNILNTTQKVTEQPYVGTFFASSNASTWLPQPQADMMMILNKCEFPVNTSYTFICKTEASDKETKYETMNFSSAYQEFQGAKVSWEISQDNGNSYIPVNANTDISYPTTATIPTQSSLYFKATARTINKDVSPVINTERLSAIFVKNIIENDYNPETNGELNPYASDNGEYKRARYITKIVNLEEGFESSGFKLLLAVNKPAGTKIQAFLKHQTAEQTEEFHKNKYVQLIPDMGVSAFDAYTTSNAFIDVKFTLPQDAPAPFNKFAVKLCLYSDDAASVPQIRDLRGIAVL